MLWCYPFGHDGLVERQGYNSSGVFFIFHDHVINVHFPNDHLTLSSATTMSTTSLPWTNIILATTELHAIAGQRKETVQWHSEGTTMYIVVENREEIDVRIDREVFNVQVSSLSETHPVSNKQQYQNPESVNGKAILQWRMQWNRPLEWASGTDFDAYYNDTNQIAMMIDLTDEEDRDNYVHFVRWLEGTIPGEAAVLTENDASAAWKLVSEYGFPELI